MVSAHFRLLVSLKTMVSNNLMPWQLRSIPIYLPPGFGWNFSKWTVPALQAIAISTRSSISTKRLRYDRQREDSSPLPVLFFFICFLLARMIRWTHKSLVDLISIPKSQHCPSPRSLCPSSWQGQCEKGQTLAKKVNEILLAIYNDCLGGNWRRFHRGRDMVPCALPVCSGRRQFSFACCYEVGRSGRNQKPCAC